MLFYPITGRDDVTILDDIKEIMRIIKSKLAPGHSGRTETVEIENQRGALWEIFIWGHGAARSDERCAAVDEARC